MISDRDLMMLHIMNNQNNGGSDEDDEDDSPILWLVLCFVFGVPLLMMIIG